MLLLVLAEVVVELEAAGIVHCAVPGAESGITQNNWAEGEAVKLLILVKLHPQALKPVYLHHY